MNNSTQVQLALFSNRPSHRTYYSSMGSHLRDRSWERGRITLNQDQVKNSQENCRTYCVAELGHSWLKVDKQRLASSPACGLSGEWKNIGHTQRCLLLQRSLDIEQFPCLPKLVKGCTCQFALQRSNSHCIQINKKMANN